MESTFVIHYGYYLTGGRYESHTTKVKRCMSELHAKVKLEDYLKKKQPDFVSLVIYSCKRDVENPFGDIFGDLFGGFNKK